MSLAHELLEQAQVVATLDPRRPRQVNLRRAVSVAYYALFHLLTGEAARSYASDLEIFSRLSRVYNHGEMRQVSLKFMSDKLPRAIQRDRPYSTPLDLKLVAEVFVTLQTARHNADYDLGLILRRGETLAFVQRARDAFAAWDRVRKTDDARLYLACLLLWKRWDDDPR